jgi:UDP-N-acetylmuramoylalanine--D-glutamate ligase
MGSQAVLPAGVDLLVKSPGVPNESSVAVAAIASGIPIWSEVEFASRFLANRWIGITGTNGKTTTTELVGQILRDAGVPAEVAGNIGRALANLPGAVDERAVIVAELSSFQLEHIVRFRPDVAVLLNLTEDHIDRHGAYRDYVAAKLRIFENQTPRDLALLNADDPGIADALRAGLLPGRARRGRFSLSDDERGGALLAGVSAEGVWLRTAAGREPLCALEKLALKGDHNVANSLAAAAVAAALGVPPASIGETLRTFPGVAHRLQVVGVVAGVTFVNDSKATNVDAALKALTAYSGPVFMILGGSLKGASFDVLAEATEGRIKEALLIGSAAGPLSDAFERRRAAVGPGATPFVVLPDLEAAVAYAAHAAAPGDVVLLSPACASFDQYRNFEQRGEHFSDLVHRLEELSAP